jgi:hypothetical protein
VSMEGYTLWSPSRRRMVADWGRIPMHSSARLRNGLFDRVGGAAYHPLTLVGTWYVAMKLLKCLCGTNVGKSRSRQLLRLFCLQYAKDFFS